MQASNAPTKSAVPFANSGTKNTIPVASQIGITPGLASFTDGFPPLTMTPLAAGGVPPYGADFNGILNFLSASARWGQAGGGYTYDAAFSTAIGGYPKGATLVRSDLAGYWLNTVENNLTNPDSGGAGWVSLGSGIATAAQAQALTDNQVLLTPGRLADAFKGGNQNTAANGFQKLPGGLIEQWGTATVTSGAVSITLPTAYLSAHLSVVVTEASASGWNTSNVSCYGTYGRSLTGFVVNAFTWNGTGFAGGITGNICWRSIGR